MIIKNEEKIMLKYETENGNREGVKLKEIRTHRKRAQGHQWVLRQREHPAPASADP